MTLYRLENYTVDTARREIARDGEVLALEPKAFDVFIYLMQHRERAVSRDELIEHIWDGRVVTDGVLTQAIAKLRRVFGDDAEALLKTVHGTGYRFVATPRELQQVESSHSLNGIAAASWSAWRWLFTGLALMAAAAFAWRLVPVSPPGELGDGVGDSVVIAVTPFSATTASNALSSTLLLDTLRFRLAEVNGVIVRDVAYTAQQFDPVAPIASGLRMQVDWLFGGQIEAVPGSERQRLTVSLWNTHEAREFHLGVYSLPNVVDVRSTEQLVEIREQIVEYALKRMPQHLVVAQPKGRIPQAMADFEAYSEAQRRLDLEECDSTIVNLLQPLVDRTPNFVQAQMALAYAHYNRFWACGSDSAELAEAVAAADALLAIVPGYPEAINAKALALTSDGRIQEARDAVEQALDTNPDSAILHVIESNVLNYFGELDRSLAAMERALQLDPLVLVAELGASPNVFMYTGNWQRYLDTHPATAASYFGFQRGYASFRGGDVEAAVANLQNANERVPRTLYSDYSAALLAVVEQRYADARELLQLTIQRRAADGHADGEVAYREAMLLLLAKDTEGALEQWDLAWQQGFKCFTCTQIDPLWTGMELLLEEWRIGEATAE